MATTNADSYRPAGFPSVVEAQKPVMRHLKSTQKRTEPSHSRHQVDFLSTSTAL